MSVYNDMANDAGYSYGTDENELMAQHLEEQERREYDRWQYELYLRDNIYPYLEWWFNLGKGNF